jgi:kinesin family protein C1
VLGQGSSWAWPAPDPPLRLTPPRCQVFAPGTAQECVFEEISELVQSALDGHKVCVFAYGESLRGTWRAGQRTARGGG